MKTECESCGAIYTGVSCKHEARIEMLNVALTTVDNRITQLLYMRADCPLCQKYDCLSCPVSHGRKKNCVMACSKYSSLLDHVYNRLIAQQNAFQKEYAELTGAVE